MNRKFEIALQVAPLSRAIGLYWKLGTLFFILMAIACSKDERSNPVGLSELPNDSTAPPQEESIEDEELLDLVQETTFTYFWDYAQTQSGAARERYHPGEPGNDPNTVTVGGTGFGLMALLVGIERGYISRTEGVARVRQILTFLESADRFHGAWPHWLDGTTGQVRPFSEKDDGGDLVETAFLAQGLICIYEYFKEGSIDEKAVANQADSLWKQVDWAWFTQGQNVLYWHWSPTYDFEMNHQLRGYNETLIAYVLAAASPDFGIDKAVYTSGWAGNGQIESNVRAYNLALEVDHDGNLPKGGPLFWAHYSFLGLNPNGLSDEFVDFGSATGNHAKINYAYCLENPKNFKDYGENCWGLTASYSRNTDGTLGYTAHSPSNDTGVISPTAALASIPYTPEESIRAMHFFYEKKDILLGPAGFYDAFSPPNGYWVAEAYLAIDQGPIIIMIENYRSGLLWNLFMKNEDIGKGLDKLNFTYAQ